MMSVWIPGRREPIPQSHLLTYTWALRQVHACIYTHTHGILKPFKSMEDLCVSITCPGPLPASAILYAHLSLPLSLLVFFSIMKWDFVTVFAYSRCIMQTGEQSTGNPASISNQWFSLVSSPLPTDLRWGMYSHTGWTAAFQMSCLHARWRRIQKTKAKMAGLYVEFKFAAAVRLGWMKTRVYKPLGEF